MSATAICKETLEQELAHTATVDLQIPANTVLLLYLILAAKYTMGAIGVTKAAREVLQQFVNENANCDLFGPECRKLIEQMDRVKRG